MGNYSRIESVKESSDIAEVNQHLNDGWKILDIYQTENQVHFVLGSFERPST
jgi:hypothetical protein